MFYIKLIQLYLHKNKADCEALKLENQVRMNDWNRHFVTEALMLKQCVERLAIFRKKAHERARPFDHFSTVSARSRQGIFRK